MLINDLLFAFRNLRRNKLLAAINVLGLTIGISACLVIFLIANYELSFDRFQPDRDRIYRVYSVFTGVYSGINRGVSTGIYTTIKNEFSGIEAATNFHTFNVKASIPTKNQADKIFAEDDHTIIVGPEYFQIFNYYEWVAGDPNNALVAPFQVVLTESKAKAYFGNADPSEMIGREIRFQDSLVVSVSGIVKDIKEKTDFDFKNFISYSTIEKSWLKQNIPLDNWEGTNSSSQLFIKLLPGTPISKIESQSPRINAIYKEKNKESDMSGAVKFQPLTDMHFDTTVGIFDHSRSVADRSTLQTLITIAAMLLLIATINFINLETAQASRRAKEVGVRKVLGSTRRKLVLHFLVESFILSFFAVLLSIGVAWLSIHYFSDFIPQGLTLALADPTIILFIASCIFLVTLMAGLYPAFVLSSYHPALALKNLASNNKSTTRSSFIRQGLTIFQFGFSQILIIATIAIGMQINFMLNKDLGFKSEAVVSFYTPWYEKSDKNFALRNELDQIPEIQILSVNGSPPSSNGSSSSTMEFDNGKEKLKHNVYRKYGDSLYLKLYGMELLAGRNIIQSDTAKEYIINETYLHLLGFQNPRDVLGKIINKQYPVVGVVKDFHTTSLRSKIEPVVIYSEMNSASSFGLKFNSKNNKVADLKEPLEKVEAAWKKIYPDEKFEYSFLDDTLKRFYQTEERTARLSKAATGIAILISCLGLFGLSSFTVMQRTKEIGIRKVLGASVNSIMVLLSKDFLKLVMIAFIVSAPIAYYLTDWWLKDFAYRMDITAGIFVMSGLISILTAFFTVSFRTVNAAKSDPVKSLRYE